MKKDERKTLYTDLQDEIDDVEEARGVVKLLVTGLLVILVIGLFLAIFLIHP